MSTMPTIFADRRTLELLRQRERFSWFSRQLKARVRPNALSSVREHLFGQPQRPGQREKALVALALMGTDEAGELIAAFDPGDDEALSIFHAIAANVWAASMGA